MVRKRNTSMPYVHLYNHINHNDKVNNDKNIQLLELPDENFRKYKAIVR